MMLNINEDKLIAAIHAAAPGLDSATARKQAQALIANTDPRLEQNVTEWMNGQPISDCWIGKYCVNAILAIRGERDFLSALDAMNLYLSDPKAGEIKIWRARR